MRRFPLSNTLRNLKFNIKNYRAVNLRPTFQSSNHPFCTNSQLLEASYSQWFKNASKEIPAKIITQLTETLDRQYEQNQSTQKWVALPASSMAFRNPVDHQESWEDVLAKHKSFSESAFKSKLFKLVETNNLQEIASNFKLHADRDQYIDTELLVAIIKGCLKPEDHKLTLEKYPEPSLSEKDPHLNFFTPYYVKLRTRIPILYEICQLYEPKLFGNKDFQEIYVQICYHQNDMDKLQQLLFTYLNHETYDATTLSYVFTSLIQNYEVEFTKGLFSNLLTLGRQVDPIVLEVVVSQLVSVLALFENVVHVFQSWLRSLCGIPTPKTMAILIHEYAKYGDEEEIVSLRNVIFKCGLKNNMHVRLADLQSSIIMREPTHFKKTITNQDLATAESILQCAKESGDPAEVKYFFHLMVLFFSKFSNLAMVQSFISKLQKDFLHDDAIHKVISKYFVRHDQFLPLLDYLQKSDASFDATYLKDLFASFVKTYPYHAQEFAEQFQQFVRLSGYFSPLSLSHILKALQVKRLDSQLTPYCLEPPSFDSRKYESSNWKRIEWKPTVHGKRQSAAIQVDFRIGRGFRDVMRKGVKPDYKVIETTFRRLNPQNRAKILQYLKAMRFPVHDYDKLAILNLQLTKDKSMLESYVKAQPFEELNSNNIIMLGRMLLNKSLYRTNNKLLNSMRITEMNDRTHMVLLNLQLRNYLKQGHYSRMIDTINSFPIDEVVLSPYLYKQCQFIEKDLVRRLKLEKQKNCDKLDEPNCGVKLDDGNRALSSLRGLLGDIRIRLDHDKIEVNAKVHEMFQWLTTWMADPRKN